MLQLPRTQQQALLSAAAYHYGSYRIAVEKAGIDYADVIRRPRWTKPRIIRLLKEAKQEGVRAALVIRHPSRR